MRGLRTLVFVSTFAVASLSSSQTTSSSDSASPSKTASSDISAARKRLLSAIPPKLYDKWRKYGQWDYKAQGSGYRDYTLFNFGATGSAAKIDKESLLGLSSAFKPTPEDVNALDDKELQPNFAKNSVAFEKLLKMAETDSNVIRIGSDFTWLAGSSKWPRDDIGFTQERWDEYRRFFGDLSLAEGIVLTADFPGAVFFVAHSNGLCTGGSSSGYVHAASALTPLSDSPLKALDADARNNPSRHYAYVFRPLKPNWYIFYEIDW